MLLIVALCYALVQAKTRPRKGIVFALSVSDCDSVRVCMLLCIGVSDMISLLVYQTTAATAAAVAGFRSRLYFGMSTVHFSRSVFLGMYTLFYMVAVTSFFSSLTCHHCSLLIQPPYLLLNLSVRD